LVVDVAPRQVVDDHHVLTALRKVQRRGPTAEPVAAEHQSLHAVSPCRPGAGKGTRLSMNSRADWSQENSSARARQIAGSMPIAARTAAPRSSLSTPAPLSPTTSTGPWTGYAATGTPHASASSITSPRVSVRDGNTNTSAVR